MSRILTVFLLFCLLSGSLKAAGWMAGYGRGRLVDEMDIGQKDPVYLAGYGLFGKRAAIGIHDEVLTQSLFLSDEDTALLFVSLDAIGYSQAMAEALRREISERLPIVASNILITATHTHSSIDLQGLWGGIEKRQQRKIINRVINSAEQAYNNRKAARINWSTAEFPHSYNRRYKNADVLSRITTLQILDQKNHAIALLFSMGSHPVVLDNKNRAVSSDWVYYTRQKLSSELHTESIFINGVLGDVVPSLNSRLNEVRTFDFARQYGTEIANKIVAGMKNGLRLEEQLEYCTETLSVKADNLLLALLTKVLGRGTVNWSSPFGLHLQTRTSVIVLGQLVLMTTPGEPVTSLGYQLVAKHPRKAAVLSLTHDSLGYLIPAKEYGLLSDAYEERLTLSKQFADQVAISVEKLLGQCLRKRTAHLASVPGPGTGRQEKAPVLPRDSGQERYHGEG